MVTRKLLTRIAAMIAVLICIPSQADHQWGKYAWPEKPLDLVIVDNHTTTTWSAHLVSAVNDWEDATGYTNPPVVSLNIVDGADANLDCNQDIGTVQVCNDDYGTTGWLGIAQIWISKGKQIVAGVAKMNDNYLEFSTDTHAAEWRQMVECQEIAHAFGLDHQDENFSNPNLGTCMDYTSFPEGGGQAGPNNLHPNEHDYVQLEIMYGSSTDGGDGGGGSSDCPPKSKSPKCNAGNAAFDQHDPNDWGYLVSRHGGIEVYEKNLGNGYRVITHVTWTPEHAEDHDHDRRPH